MRHIKPKRCLCLWPACKERDGSPGSRQVQSGNQNDFLHVFYPEPKGSSKGEPGVDMLDHPPLKIPSCTSVLTVSIYRER